MPAVQRILPTDSLENGFRNRYNTTVNAIIDATAVSCDANGVLSFYNDVNVLLGSIDLSPYFKLQNESTGVDTIAVEYPSASDEDEGLTTYATAEEALLGAAEFKSITPATLKFVLDRLGNIPIILDEKATPGQTLKLVRDTATQDFYLTNADTTGSTGGSSGAATLDDVLKAGTDATRGKSEQPIELGGRVTLTPGKFDLIGASGYPILTVNEEGHIKLTNGLSLVDLLQLISSRDLMLINNADVVHVINTSSETRERTGQKFYVDSYERGRSISVDGALEDYYRDATGEYTNRLERNKWVTNVANMVADKASALFNLVSFKTLNVATSGELNFLVAEQVQGTGAYTIKKGNLDQLFEAIESRVDADWIIGLIRTQLTEIITDQIKNIPGGSTGGGTTNPAVSNPGLATAIYCQTLPDPGDIGTPGNYESSFLSKLTN